MSQQDHLESALRTAVAAAIETKHRQFLFVETFDAPDLSGRITRMVTTGQLEIEAYQVGTVDAVAAVDPRTGAWRCNGNSNGDPVQTLRQLANAPDRESLFVLYGLEPYMHQPQMQSALWQLQCSGSAAPHVIVLVDSTSAFGQIPDALRAQWTRVRDEMPGRAGCEALVDERVGDRAPAEIRSELSEALTGFTMTAGRAVLQRALSARERGWEAVVGLVHQEKSGLLSSTLQMDLLPPPQTEVCGMNELSQYIMERLKNICVPGKERVLGILLVGPPGTGKSLVAREIGHLTSHPVIDFRPVNLMDSLVGGTEGNFARATRTLDTLAPVVVCIDEIEKAISGGASSSRSDGGTMARSHSVLLTWLNDTVAPIFIVGTANHLHRLEDWRTLTRPGRFDEKFFVDIPGPITRGQILALALPDLPENLCRQLVADTVGFTGADLAHVARQARMRAANMEQAANQLILEEVHRMRPLAEQALQEFAELRDWARARCRKASSDLPEV